MIWNPLFLNPSSAELHFYDLVQKFQVAGPLFEYPGRLLGVCIGTLDSDARTDAKLLPILFAEACSITLDTDGLPSSTRSRPKERAHNVIAIDFISKWPKGTNRDLYLSFGCAHVLRSAGVTPWRNPEGVAANEPSKRYPRRLPRTLTRLCFAGMTPTLRPASSVGAQ